MREPTYAQMKELYEALKFCQDIAEEEYPHTAVGTGAEVALRHIKRRASVAVENYERDV